MELTYANEKVKEIFLNGDKMIKRVGLPLAKSIKKRKDQLESFVNLFELMGSGIDNPHLLKGDLYGCIGWSITGNVRIILDLELKNGEVYSLDIPKRKKICIKGVCDYHGGKNEWTIY